MLVQSKQKSKANFKSQSYSHWEQNKSSVEMNEMPSFWYYGIVGKEKRLYLSVFNRKMLLNIW